MKRTGDKNSNYGGCGCTMIIGGVILSIISINFVFFSVIFIILGMCILIVSVSSKLGDTGKRLYTIAGRMEQGEHCPKCGVIIYYKNSRQCSSCGYNFISESRQNLTTLEKKKNVFKKTSDVQMFSPISELLQKDKTLQPIPSGSELKTEEIQTASSISEEWVEKSFKSCPHCRQKLPLGAKFCFNCGKKVEVIRPISSISVVKEEDDQIDINWLKHQYHDLGRTMRNIADQIGVSMVSIKKMLYSYGIISEKKEVKLKTDVPPLKIEEAQPIQPAIEIKEEKRKKVLRICKFCGMRIPKNKTFCIQCGMLIKSKIT
ncbi:MAG: zinc ribbon domain-containing protein [Candidatus Thorarchaeota archaeon]